MLTSLKTKFAIADDHKMVRNGLVKLISTHNPGFECIIQADDGLELVNELEATKPLPDIVLLDISMPKLNGYETLKVVRNKWPKLKVLAISMYDDEYTVVKMIIGGVNGFISKKEEVGTLVYAMQKVVAGNKYFSGSDVDYSSKEIDELRQLIPTISSKEMEFLSYCGTDMKYEEIAGKMGIKTRTIDSYRDHLFNKLNLNSRIGLALFALKTGLVPNSDICQ